MVIKDITNELEIIRERKIGMGPFMTYEFGKLMVSVVDAEFRMSDETEWA